MTPLFRKAAAAIYDRGWLVLFLATLFWGVNVAAGRMAVGEITTMTLAVLRWALVCLLLIPVVWPHLKRDAPQLLARWPYVFVMGTIGFTGFTVAFYLSAHFTSGVNIAIIQGVQPVVVMLAGVIALGMVIRPVQWIGLVMSLAGVAVVATQGDFDNLRRLTFNTGDIYIAAGTLAYAIYTLGLRRKPAVHPLVLFTGFAISASISALPLLLWEIWSGAFFMPSWTGIALLVFIAIFPSFLGQMYFMRGVELVGAARASLFYNLVPVLGALSAVLFIGEPFGLYHALSLALVIGGILVAERIKST